MQCTKSDDEWVPDPYHMQSFHEKEEVFTIVGWKGVGYKSQNDIQREI